MKDKVLYFAVIILSLFGLIMIYSSSYVWAEFKYGNPYKFLINQGVFLVLGIILMTIVSKINTDIYKKCESISLILDSLSNRDILAKIIEEFDFYNRLLHVDNVNERLIKIEYFVNNSTDLNKFGMNIYALNDYFDEILNDKSEIKMKIASGDDNSVKIMTIHTSKGLEFPYVYLPMLTSNFYKTPNKNPFDLTNNYGLTLPFYNDGIGSSFVTVAANVNEMKETLSEKIRLYYVALTRAKEKVIMVLPNNEVDKLTDETNMLRYKSFADIINALKLNDITKISEISKLDVNKDYNVVKLSNYKSMIEDSNTKINLKEMNIENKVLESKHFSKAITSIIDENLRKKLDFGTFMHYVFEVYDFKNDNLDKLDIAYKITDIYPNKAVLNNIKLLNDSNNEVLKGIKKAVIKIGTNEYNLNQSLVSSIKKLEAFNYETINNLKSNTEYNGEINIYDVAGNKLKIKNNKFTIKTSKQKPEVKINVIDTDITRFKLGVEVINEDDVNIENFRYEIYDINGVLKDKGLINNNTIESKNLSANEIYSCELRCIL